MRTFNLLLIILVVVLESFGQEPQGLSIEIELKADYSVPYTKKLYYVPANKTVKEKRFDIQVSVKNNSSDTLSFWMMKCSWADNFIINNDYIDFFLAGCDGNYPRVVKIKPSDSFTWTATLTREISWDNPCENCIGQKADFNIKTTRVGLVYIDGKLDANEYENISQDKSRWTIIWSNSLELNK